jgi:hypothetical protein
MRSFTLDAEKSLEIAFEQGFGSVGTFFLLKAIIFALLSISLEIHLLRKGDTIN